MLQGAGGLLSHWRQFVQYWPLWALYIAHFTMNWSNYIVMHWLPTYMKHSLNAQHGDIMYTAAPYILNSIVGVGESSQSSLYNNTVVKSKI